MQEGVWCNLPNPCEMPVTGVLIRSYGELWSPDLVSWGKPGHGNNGRLLGEFGTKIAQQRDARCERLAL
jgi:hypothetical protein